MSPMLRKTEVFIFAKIKLIVEQAYDLLAMLHSEDKKNWPN